jgi:hypothetical protein
MQSEVAKRLYDMADRADRGYATSQDAEFLRKLASLHELLETEAWLRRPIKSA